MAGVCFPQVLNSSAARLVLFRTAAAALDKWDVDCRVMRYVGTHCYIQGT